MNRRTFGQTLLGMLAVCGIGKAATREPRRITDMAVTCEAGIDSYKYEDGTLHTKCLTHYHIHENIPAWRAERVWENGQEKWISYQRGSNGEWVKTMESCDFPVCPCVTFKKGKA